MGVIGRGVVAPRVVVPRVVVLGVVVPGVVVLESVPNAKCVELSAPTPPKKSQSLKSVL